MYIDARTLPRIFLISKAKQCPMFLSYGKICTWDGWSEGITTQVPISTMSVMTSCAMELSSKKLSILGWRLLFLLGNLMLASDANRDQHRHRLPIEIDVASTGQTCQLHVYKYSVSTRVSTLIQAKGCWESENWSVQVIGTSSTIICIYTLKRTKFWPEIMSILFLMQ